MNFNLKECMDWNS